MQLTFIGQSNYDYDANYNQVYAPKPPGTQNGDIMFALVMLGNNTITSVPTGWTLLKQQNAYYEFVWIYYKIANNEPTSNYTWEARFNKTVPSLTIATYRGDFDINDPIETFSSGNYVTSDTVLRANAISVSNVNTALLFIGFVGSNNTVTKPTTPTNAWNEDINRRNELYSGRTNRRIFCSMIWSSSGSTGNVDGSIQNYNQGKAATLVALRPSIISNSNFFQLF